MVQAVRIPARAAERIASALRESQADKARFHRTAVLRLQQRYVAVQSNLDPAYEAFDRGTLCPTYTSPFDLFVKRNETGDWLGGRESNPDNVVQRGKK